jgi:hypothetical protein
MLLCLSLIMGVLILAILYLIGKPISYIWVMDWDSPANMGHVVKMCSNGHRLFQEELGVTGRIAIDQRDGTLWAPRYYDEHGVLLKQVYKIGTDGTTLNYYSNFSGDVAAIDPKDGNIWSTDTGYLRKFNSKGELLEQYEGFEYPFWITVDPRDNTIWVADNSNTDRGKLRHLYPNGVEIFSIKTNGVMSLAIDPLSGSVWYTDLHRNAYNLLTDNNQLVKLTKVESVDHAFFVTVSSKDETVWIGEVTDDNKSGALVKLSPEGEMIQKIILQDRPYFVEINPYDNSVWIGMRSKVAHMSANGRFLGQTNGFQTPEYIAFAPNLADFMINLKCAFYSYF